MKNERDRRDVYFCSMKVTGNVMVPDELQQVCFACDVTRCKGACCVEGDAGAPLTEEEISLLEDYIDRVLPFMEKAGQEVVRRHGVFDWDMEGNYVTPLVNDRECAFACFINGIAHCAIEKAWEAGILPMRKPESCHLYPLRLSVLDNGMVNIVYHRWPICNSALENGLEQGISLQDFLKEALIRKFGEEWYRELKSKSEQTQ